VRQPFGDLYLQLHLHDDGPRPIVVEKGSGRTEIFVDEGVQLQLRGTVGKDVEVSWLRVDPDAGQITDSGFWPSTERGGRWTVSENISSDTSTVTTVQPVTVDQSSGVIVVTVNESVEEDR
jgi:hypothetical protein